MPEILDTVLLSLILIALLWLAARVIALGRAQAAFEDIGKVDGAARVLNAWGALEASRDEDSFLKAVVAYHLIGEGSIGRANQNFVADQFDRIGSFPGLREAQRLAVRDEVRHIGIGVSYARRRLTRDGAYARALIDEIVEGFDALGHNLVEHATPDVVDRFVGAYGAAPATLWAEVLRQLHLRLRSIGISDVRGARTA